LRGEPVIAWRSDRFKSFNRPLDPAIAHRFHWPRASVYTQVGSGKEVIRMAKAIDEEALERNRTPEQREAWARLLKQAEAQGIKPLTREDLDAMAKAWPEDEDIDDFIAAVQQWRSEGGEREMP
jgi:hypothetical protein